MSRFSEIIRLSLCGLACAAALGAAHASEYPSEFIMEPKYFRGLEIAADIELGGYYDDNILLQSDDRKSDFITVVKPSLAITKKLGRHEFTWAGDAAIRRYASHHNENVETGGVGFSGNLEALRQLQLPFSVRYNKEVDERINRRPGLLTVKPQDLERFTASGGIVYQPNRFRLDLIGSYEALRADDAVFMNGAIARGKDRDTDEYTGEARFSYALGTGWTPYLSLVYQRSDDIYPAYTPTGFNGLERDNDVYKAQAGFEMDYKNILLGGAGIGYETRDYTARNIESVDAVSLDADLKYNITRRTSLGLVAARATYEDNLIQASYVETAGRLSLEHALTARLYGGLTGGYITAHYKETRREDDEYQGKASLLYLLDKGLALEAAYTYQTRDSTIDVLSYDRSVVFLNLKKQF